MFGWNNIYEVTKEHSRTWPIMYQSETHVKLKSCAWWHHQMETFFALLALSAGNSPVTNVVTGEFPAEIDFKMSFGEISKLQQLLDCTIPVMTRAYDIMASANGKFFRLTGPLCGEFNGHRWIHLPTASDAALWCSLDLRLNKRLRKQSRDWGFQTPSCSLWRQCNVVNKYELNIVQAETPQANIFIRWKGCRNVLLRAMVHKKAIVCKYTWILKKY